MFKSGNPLEENLKVENCSCGKCGKKFSQEDLSLIRLGANTSKALFILFEGNCTQCNYNSIFSYYTFVSNGKKVCNFGIDYCIQKPQNFKRNKYSW